MNEIKQNRNYRTHIRRYRGRFMAPVLVGLGGLWLVKNLGWVNDSAEVVLPILLILWGFTSLLIRRYDSPPSEKTSDE